MRRGITPGDLPQNRRFDDSAAPWIYPRPHRASSAIASRAFSGARTHSNPTPGRQGAPNAAPVELLVASKVLHQKVEVLGGLLIASRQFLAVGSGFCITKDAAFGGSGAQGLLDVARASRSGSDNGTDRDGLATLGGASAEGGGGARSARIAKAVLQ